MFRPQQKMRTAVEGIWFAARTDFSVRYKLVLSAFSLIATALFETLFHFLFVLAVTGLMLAAELFNTAIEELCDYVQPALDDRIKATKDMAAAATMVTIVLWYVIVAVVLFELLVVFKVMPR